MQVDEFGGKQKKAKNSTANESLPGWETTPKNEIPKGLKEEIEEGKAKFVHGRTKVPLPNYDLYHKTYSGAVQAAADTAKKKGYEVDQDSWDAEISFGQRKPSVGKTVSKKVKLTKDGKEQKKQLHIQVYGMDSGKYELNMYIEEVEVDEMKMSSAAKQKAAKYRRSSAGKKAIKKYLKKSKRPGYRVVRRRV